MLLSVLPDPRHCRWLHRRQYLQEAGAETRYLKRRNLCLRFTLSTLFWRIRHRHLGHQRADCLLKHQLVSIVNESVLKSSCSWCSFMWPNALARAVDHNAKLHELENTLQEQNTGQSFPSTNSRQSSKGGVHCKTEHEQAICFPFTAELCCKLLFLHISLVSKILCLLILCLRKMWSTNV